MKNSENLSLSSLSIRNSDGITESGTDISALDKRQKDVLKTKASINEQQEADATPFTQWMISIDQSPRHHKDLENEYNTKFAPALEELEVTMQSNIDVLSTFNQEKFQLATNPMPATAIALE